MARVVEEVFLRYQDAGSNKGFVSRLIDNEDGTWTHWTAWGAVGRTFQQPKQQPVMDEAKARASHTKKVREKMTGDTPYVTCDPAELGFEATLGGQVAAQAVVEVAKERLWSPMLLTAISRPESERVLQSDDYFAQQKADGVRMRLYAGADGVVRACNRKGQALPVPQVIQALGLHLFERVGPFDLDGEGIGNDQFWAFESLRSPEAPAIRRFQDLEAMTPHLPAGIRIVPTAFQRDDKLYLRVRAQDEGWEGLVFKRKHAPYHSGRSARDYKFKQWNTATVLLTGINATGKLEHGSAQMSILRDGRLVRIGNVSSGFKQGELEAIAAQIFEMQVLVAEVRYLYFSEAALFQPCFLRLRADASREDVAAEAIYGRDGKVAIL